MCLSPSKGRLGKGKFRKAPLVKDMGRIEPRSGKNLERKISPTPNSNNSVRGWGVFSGQKVKYGKTLVYSLYTIHIRQFLLINKTHYFIINICQFSSMDKK